MAKPQVCSPKGGGWESNVLPHAASRGRGEEKGKEAAEMEGESYEPDLPWMDLGSERVRSGDGWGHTEDGSASLQVDRALGHRGECLRVSWQTQVRVSTLTVAQRWASGRRSLFFLSYSSFPGGEICKDSKVSTCPGDKGQQRNLNSQRARGWMELVAGNQWGVQPQHEATLGETARKARRRWPSQDGPLTTTASPMGAAVIGTVPLQRPEESRGTVGFQWPSNARGWVTQKGRFKLGPGRRNHLNSTFITKRVQVRNS